jgi:hypothetical protein
MIFQEIYARGMKGTQGGRYRVLLAEVGLADQRVPAPQPTTYTRACAMQAEWAPLLSLTRPQHGGQVDGAALSMRGGAAGRLRAARTCTPRGRPLHRRLHAPQLQRRLAVGGQELLCCGDDRDAVRARRALAFPRPNPPPMLCFCCLSSVSVHTCMCAGQLARPCFVRWQLGSYACSALSIRLHACLPIPTRFVRLWYFSLLVMLFKK